MSEGSVTRIVAGFLCLGLCALGFYYDSSWAFVGAFFAFLGAID
jgi:hypothetical protein